MPFLLSFFFFLNGGVWTLYAVLVADWFLGVPNGMGLFLGAVQLIIYAIYRNPNSSKQIIEDLEQADQTERLLPPSSNPTQEGGNSLLDIVGGVYKGRAYGFCSEKNFHRLQCGLQGIGGSATMLDKQLEETRQEIRELARKYEEERKEGWMSSDVGRHLSQTSKNSSLK
ncbi:Bidirectional sugar transporter SWEET16 [Capsicum annuum]|nr:Bidirectional sugar transporter SWEET16 [Capsicum annuum]